MALQPFRPAGSTQVLRFRGKLELSADNFGTYPIANGEVPANVVSGVAMGVRFLLADATDPLDPTTTLPQFVYDDGQPAGTAPRTPGYGAIANVTTATDANVSNRTWVHNLYVTIRPLTPNDAAWFTAVEDENAFIVLDGVDSGLGTNTGLPVLILPMVFNFTQWNYQEGPDVDLLIEVRQTSSR